MGNVVSKSEKQGFLNKLTGKIKDNKKLQFVLFGICVLLCLIVVMLNINDKSTNISNSSTAEAYVQNLENKLEKSLSKVKGVGKVSVLLTVESGMETVLASKVTTTETLNGKEVVETPIIVNGKTVIVKEVYPKIIGVLIVCEGANNISVMAKIQQATLSLLDIKLEQIEILSM